MAAPSPIAETTAPVTLRVVPTPDTDTTDLYQAARLLRAELDCVRAEMGKPRPSVSPMVVTNAPHNELFAQVWQTHQRLRVLRQELTHDRSAALRRPSSTLTEGHSAFVLTAAIEEVRAIKHALEIGEVNHVTRPRTRPSSTDVYLTLQEVERQVDVLLNAQPRPCDVFSEVRAALTRVRTIGRLVGVREWPGLPQFVRRKSPADVCRTLLHCFERVQSIAEEENVETLHTVQAIGDSLEDERITTSDVLPVIRLLNAELRYLHDQLGSATKIRRHVNPSRVFPSHVDQQARHLLECLDTLAAKLREKR